MIYGKENETHELLALLVSIFREPTERSVLGYSS
jgi:hypothetical protein